MSFFDFSIKRECFIYSNKSRKNSNPNFDSKKVFKLNESFNLIKIKFLKPCLLKNFDGFSDFPFLALSNGSLFFYTSAYANSLIEPNLAQSGLTLFDDLYSYKNKIIF